MTTHPYRTASLIRGARTRCAQAMVAFISATLAATPGFAQAPAPSKSAAPAPAATSSSPPAAASASAPSAQSASDLEKLVDRIALYPDDLIAIILPASTSPLQIVQADRFLDQRKANPKLELDPKWDDPVKTLCNYPDVVKMMSKDLDWTAALGEAVVEDTGEVMEAIQSFRRKTQAAGNLKTDEKQVIVVEKEVIKIQPADPQVIYVPTYNPSTVVVYGGYSSWGYYPYGYPSYYYPYPPGAALATGLIWGAAIGAVWGGNHYGANWGGGNNNININRNTNINTGNINTGNRGNAGNSSQWKSNKSSGQVSSSVGKTATSRSAAGYGGGSGGGAKASAQSAGGGSAASRNTSGMGSSGAARSSSSGSSAFGGSGASSGRQTSMDSSRGASSRSSSASAGARSSGGASRGGGGGGRGGGRR